jgi:hypothetical protein
MPHSPLSPKWQHDANTENCNGKNPVNTNSEVMQTYVLHFQSRFRPTIGALP